MPYPGGPPPQPAPLPPQHSNSGYHGQLPPSNSNRGPSTAPPPSTYYHHHHHHQGPPLQFYVQHHQNYHYPPPHHQHSGGPMRHSHTPQQPLSTSNGVVPNGAQPAVPYKRHSTPGIEKNSSPPSYRHPVSRLPPPVNAQKQIDGGSYTTSSSAVYNVSPGCTCKKSKC
jgi:hypothetical protein